MSGRVLKMALVAAALLLSVTVHAAALFESVSGDVRVVSGGQAPVPVEQGERLDSGSTVITGADGLAILRFDDQQKVAILRSSEFTVVDYNYSPGVATADRSELALNRGAVRILSGRIARRNHAMFVLRTPQVTLGARGTEFSVAVVGQTFWSVSEGAVAATTNVGTGIYGKGSYGRSQSLERLASGLSPHALPLSVLAVFDELDSPSLAAALAPGRR